MSTLYRDAIKHFTDELMESLKYIYYLDNSHTDMQYLDIYNSCINTIINNVKSIRECMNHLVNNYELVSKNYLEQRKQYHLLQEKYKEIDIKLIETEIDTAGYTIEIEQLKVGTENLKESYVQLKTNNDDLIIKLALAINKNDNLESINKNLHTINENNRYQLIELNKEIEALKKRIPKSQGRPSSLTPEAKCQLLNLLDQGQTKTEIAKVLNVSRKTIYNTLKRIR